MNSILYDELRIRHRRFPVHYRRTATSGLVALGIVLLLAGSQPNPGPSLVACGGWSAGGLLVLFGLRGLPRERRLRSLTQAWIPRLDQWFPATLVFLQNLFIALTLLPLWMATVNLGFPATPLLHGLLIGLLALAPVHRILQGTHTTTASAGREIVVELVRYTYVCWFTLFLTALMHRLMTPPGGPSHQPWSAGVIFLWLPCVLVMLGSLVLFLDHLVRKMPAPQAPAETDTLD